jgi:hypothetical protein
MSLPKVDLDVPSEENPRRKAGGIRITVRVIMAQYYKVLAASAEAYSQIQLNPNWSKVQAFLQLETRESHR